MEAPPVERLGPPPVDDGPRQVVNKERRVEYRDEKGNILNPDQVKDLEGKVKFEVCFTFLNLNYANSSNRPNTRQEHVFSTRPAIKSTKVQSKTLHPILTLRDPTQRLQSPRETKKRGRALRAQMPTMIKKRSKAGWKKRRKPNLQVTRTRQHPRLEAEIFHVLFLFSTTKPCLEFLCINYMSLLRILGITGEIKMAREP
jgi:hypothetical protein